MSQSGSAKRVTCITVVTGRISPKNSPCTCPTLSQSVMRVRRIRVRITWERSAPRPSRAMRMISKQRRAWAGASPGVTVLPSGPRGAVPPTAIIEPIRTARAMPRRGSYGEPDETEWREELLIILPLSFARMRLLYPCKRDVVNQCVVQRPCERRKEAARAEGQMRYQPVFRSIAEAQAWGIPNRVIETAGEIEYR